MDGPSEPADRLAECARRARRGDRRAAAELLRALQDTIYRFALAQLRDDEAAREATQETAVRVLQSIHRYDGRSRASTWALGVALNVCRERRRQRSGVDHDLSLVPSPDAPEAPVEARDDADLLRTKIDRLPPRQREAVVLRYFEQLSVRDTAEAMGCSEGAVKASLWQALRRLRRELGFVLGERSTP